MVHIMGQRCLAEMNENWKTDWIQLFVQPASWECPQIVCFTLRKLWKTLNRPIFARRFAGQVSFEWAHGLS